jgi:hypothetical protein
LIWTKSLQDLQKFVEELLNLADCGWCPGGGAKQFKSEDIDLRWYPDTQTITLNGKLKDEIGEIFNSAALISGKLADETGKEALKQDGHIEETHVTSTLNINDSRDVNDVNRPFVDEIQCEEAIPNVIEKIPANSCSIQDDQMLSLEALQS